MKAFRLMMMAGLMAFAGAANAQEVTVLTAADIQTDADGKANLVIKMDYDTEEVLIGLNFSLVLPEGVDINAKSDTEAAKQAVVKINKEVFQLYSDEDAYNEAIADADYAGAAAYAISYTTLKKRAEGGYLLNFIDQTSKTPFVNTHGTAVTIPLIANPADVAGFGKIFNIGLSNNLDQGFATFGNGATIADVEFKINEPVTDGINEVKNAQENGAIYNAAGQRLEKAAKGLYIQNGKKYVK